MADLFTNRTTALLTKVLDGTSERQRVLANNIANADTPGYLRQEVTFEGELRQIITAPPLSSDAQIAAIERVPLGEIKDTASPQDENGNNVVVEQEMVDVAKNSLQYESAAQLLGMQFRSLRSAIHEGRR